MNFKEDLGRNFVIIFLVMFLGLGSINLLPNKIQKTSLGILPITNKEESIITSDTDTDSYDIAAQSKIKTLDDFVKSAISKSSTGIQVTPDSSMFSYLNEKILNDNQLINQESLADYNIRIKKLKKMQRLAFYISGNYKLPLKSAENIVYASYVEANKKNLDPNLVLSLIGVESTFNQYSKSGAGAVGLTQVMPNIHRDKISKLNDKDIWSVQGNIKIGTDILKEYLVLSRGNVTDALQRYNGSLGDEKLTYSNKIFSKMHNFNKL